MSCLKKMYNLPDPSENYAYYRSIVRKQTKKSSNCIPMFGKYYYVHNLMSVCVLMSLSVHICISVCVTVSMCLCVSCTCTCK